METSSARDSTENTPSVQSTPPGVWRRIFDVVSYTPERCRWDPDNPPKFTWFLNILFGVAACATVANLYYSHPILNVLAADFGVDYQTASLVPTLSQAGYAAGLLFICPLGDLFPRRPFVLVLIWFTGTLWIGLCLTRSFVAFAIIHFITGATTVTPQLMLPLAGQLASPHRRATAISIVVSGLLLGLLVARLLSGIITNFVSWRVVFWIGFALQYMILILLWLFMPDYPSSNPGGLNYFKMLWSIVLLIRREPALVQACLIGLFTSASFTSFWTTLTFLLAGSPYQYSSLIIGCFAFIGIGAMTLGPTVARFFIDRFNPLLSVILGEFVCLISNAIGAYAGKITVAGPILQALGLDIGLQTSQISNRTAIYNIDHKAQNRINTAYMFSVFMGQVIGTAVGNDLYARAGWVGSGTFNVATIGVALFFCLVRGPQETGWVGWSGGINFRRRDLEKSEDLGKSTKGSQDEAKNGTSQVQDEENTTHPAIQSDTTTESRSNDGEKHDRERGKIERANDTHQSPID